MDEMRRRMIARGVPAHGGIHRHTQVFAFSDASLADGSLVQDDRRGRPRRLLDIDHSFRPRQGSLISDLTTAFSIEGRDIHRQLDNLPFCRFLDELFAFQNSPQDAVAFQMLIADECRSSDPFGQLRDDRSGRFLFESAGLARASPLLFDRRIETRFVDRHALFPAGLGDQVHGEAVGVIEFEDVIPHQYSSTCRLRPLDHLVQNR